MARERGEEKEKEEVQEEPKKKRSPKLFIIIGVVVALLLGGAGGAYYFLFMGKSGTSGSHEDAAEDSHGKKGAAVKGANKNLDPFIVNLTDAQGTRYLKAVMQLELSSGALGAELDEKMPMIRDDIISLLSSKSFEDISTEPGKRELKKAIIERINRSLQGGQVTRVFFTEFVVQ